MPPLGNPIAECVERIVGRPNRPEAVRARQKVGLGERAVARTRDSQFQGYHKSLTARLGFKKAIGATARWVRMLKEHGFPPEMSERTDRVAD